MYAYTYAMTVSPIGFVPQMDFADRLRKARRVSGLSQEDMCNALQVKQGRYGHWESGRSVPPDLHMVCLAIAAVTGISAQWLETGQAPHDGGPDGLTAVAGRGFEPLTSGLQASGRNPFRAVA